MALKETTPVTAIATSTHVLLGEMGAGETLSEAFEDLGIIDADSLSITTTDGTVHELKDINGDLIDQVKLQPSITVGFTLQKPSEKTRGKFWDLRESGEGDARKVQVVSLIQNAPMSLMFANTDNIGSETFEAPKCSISMNLEYNAAKGYTGVCTAVLLKPQRVGEVKPELFQFGVVAPPLVATPSSLSFEAAANTAGKTITVTSEGNLTAATASESWATVTKTTKIATVKTSANTGADARSCIVTLTADGKTTRVTVTQAGATA